MPATLVTTAGGLHQPGGADLTLFISVLQVNAWHDTGSLTLAAGHQRLSESTKGANDIRRTSECQDLPECIAAILKQMARVLYWHLGMVSLGCVAPGGLCCDESCP